MGSTYHPIETVAREARVDESRRPPIWDRPDTAGLAASVIIPLGLVVIGNGLLLLTGGEENPDYRAVSWNPPGWLIGAIWCVIYPLWGAARWRVALSGERRAGRSMWVVALIVWGLCYPIVTAFVGTAGSVVANVFSLLLAIVTVMRVWPVSRSAVALIGPSIVWLLVANVLGFAALEQALRDG